MLQTRQSSRIHKTAIRLILPGIGVLLAFLVGCTSQQNSDATPSVIESPSQTESPIAINTMTPAVSPTHTPFPTFTFTAQPEVKETERTPTATFIAQVVDVSKTPTLDMAARTATHESEIEAVQQTATAIANNHQAADTPTATVQSTGGRPTQAASNGEDADVTFTPTPNILQATGTEQAIIAATHAASNPTELSNSGDEPTNIPIPTETSTASPTPPPTSTPVLASPVPTLPVAVTQIAAAPIEFRSASGIKIGTGIFRVFARPAQVDYPQTVYVELTLDLNSALVTAVPGSPIPTFTASPAPMDQTPTDTPAPATSTSTPFVTSPQRDIYQLMGASLLCSERSFYDCDAEVAAGEQKRIKLDEPTLWTWTLSPKEEISGAQDLRIVAWVLLEDVNNPDFTVVEEIWSANFPITIVIPQIQDATGLPNFTLLVFIIGVIASIAVLTFLLITLMRRHEQTAPTKPSGSRPTVFISYRRDPSFATARLVSDKLAALGADVFIDVESINEGRFADIIEKAIAERTYFIPIIAPETLESVWVRREIAHAIKNDCRIIPLLVGGFTFGEAALPDDIRDLNTYNAIPIVPQYFDAAMEKLARYMKLID